MGGDNDEDLGSGGRVVVVIVVVVVVEPSGQRTWGKGCQRDDDDGEMGGHVLVFVIDVNVDAVNSDPSCRASPLPRRWGKKAMALMLWRHVRGWHCQGVNNKLMMELIYLLPPPPPSHRRRRHWCCRRLASTCAAPPRPPSRRCRRRTSPPTSDVWSPSWPRSSLPLPPSPPPPRLPSSSPQSMPPPQTMRWQGGRVAGLRQFRRHCPRPSRWSRWPRRPP